MNKQYFNYLIKSKKGAITFVVILYVLFYITVTITTSGVQAALIGFLTAGIILGILSYVIVPIMFNYVHNKKAVDSYFCLPISRREMLVTTMVFSLMVVIVPFVILSIASLVLLMVKTNQYSIADFMMIVILASITSAILILFNSAIYLEANTVFDGIVLIMAYGILPFILALVIDCFCQTFIYGYYAYGSISIEPYLSMPYSLVVKLFDLEPMLVKDVAFKIPNLTSFGICALWHLIFSFMSLNRNYIERKVERAETISNNFFSYPFIRYSYVLILVFITSFTNFGSSIEFYLPIYVTIFIAFIVSFFIYRRKIMITIKDVAFFLAVIIVSNVFGIIAYNMEGFGIPYKYERENVNAVFEYSSYNYDFDHLDEDEKWLKELINDNFKNPESCNVYFDVEINPNNLNINKEVLDVFNNLRDRNIEYYYESPRYSIVSRGNLVVRDIVDKNAKRPDISYSYPLGLKLTKEELITINKNFNVYIEVFDTDGYIQVSLNDLLSKTN